jgi:transposase
MLEEMETGSMEQNHTPLIVVTAEERAAVDARLRRRDLAPRVRERLEMVKAAGQGQEVATIVLWSGRSARTVRHWLRRFLTDGIDGLADAPRSGRPVRADAAYRRALEAAVETPPRDLDLGFDVWTSARLSAYLETQTGVHIAPGWVRVLLGQLDFVSGRPKHTLKHLRDPDAVAASVAEIEAAEKNRGSSAGALRAPS